MTYTARHRLPPRSLAYGLGWFSIGLGLIELVSAPRIAAGIGAPAREGLIRIYGVREILSGVAILSSSQPGKLVWGRVAGDLLDLLSVAPTLDENNPQRKNAIGAAAFVAGATLLDAYVASRPSGRQPTGVVGG